MRGWWSLLLLLTLAPGCGSGGSSGAGTSSGAGRSQVAPGGAGEPGQNLQASVEAPSQATVTIFCRDFTGVNHATTAERVRQQVQEISGLKDFYLVRSESRTVLYHGFYATLDPTVDRREAERARADRRRIEELVDARTNAKLFPGSIFEPLQRPDPPAPAEWDLHNAKGYWTLLVATYAGHAQSKQAAVDSVREARKQGFEAYYLHKEAQSHVCIGTWPASAVKRGTSMFEQNREKEQRGQVNPYAPPIKVLSVGPMDPYWKQLRDQGWPLELYEVRAEIVDPSLNEMYAKLGYSVNGDYLASEYPLLLEIPPTINRAAAPDLEAARPTSQPSQDPLLRRY
jgi:hypothetical protein